MPLLEMIHDPEYRKHYARYLALHDRAVPTKLVMRAELWEIMEIEEEKGAYRRKMRNGAVKVEIRKAFKELQTHKT